jgi:hypothetical protein
MSFGGGGGGSGTQVTQVTPYAAAEPALGQIFQRQVHYTDKDHKPQVTLHQLNKHYKVWLTKKH